jgi:hypothetical protein
LKLVAWVCPLARAIKKPRFAPEPAFPSELMSLDFYSDHSVSKNRMVSNGFWHIVSVVKERAPLSSRKAHLQPNEYAKGVPECQQQINDFHRDSQRHRRH